MPPANFTPNVQNIQKLVPFIEKEKEIIVGKWVQNHSVNRVLNNFNIDSDFFIKIFGIPVVEYFIGVVSGKKKVGECPIMNKFIAFLIETGVEAVDVFTICMGLRKSLIKHLFANNKINDKPEVYLDEFTELFDTNLTGVLSVFADMSKQKDKELKRLEHAERKQKRFQAILNSLDNMVCIFKDDKITTANKNFLEAFSAKSLQEFHELFPNYDKFVQKIFVNEGDFKNKDYALWLDKLAKEKDKTTKIHLYDKASDKTKVFVLKVSKLSDTGYEFLLSFTDISEYDAKYEKLQVASELDPLTKLYNSQKFEQTLYQEIINKKKSAAELYVILFEIDNIGSIFDAFGEILRDSILIKIANVAKEIIDPAMLLARIRTARYAVICKNADLGKCRSISSNIQKSINYSDFGIERRVTCSFVIVKHIAGESKHEILLRSNRLFEEAKAEGLNRIKDDVLLLEREKLQKENEKKILKELSYAKKEQTPIKATAFYKEIPILSDMLIVFIGDDRIVLEQKNKSAFSFSPKEIYLQTIYLTDTVLGDIAANNSQENTISVTNLRYAQTAPTQRKQIRIIPSRDIYVTVKTDECAVAGHIKDISLTSVCIRLNNIEKVKTEDKVSGEFSLFKEDKNNKITIEGYIHDIKRIKNEYFIVVVFTTTKECDKKLSEYISTQQIETIREFKNIVNSYTI